MKLSFSLAKPKAAPAPPPPSLKRPAAFALGEDDEPIDAAPTSSAADKGTAANKKLLAQNVHSSRTMQKRMEAEKRVDQTVYEYDEVWDKMQESKQRQKEAKEVESKDRRPKYISGLLASAQTRKLDYLRAEEKMMQLEREAEGDEFTDKESFVTQAYKDQMAAVRAAEEEEKKRDGESKQGGATSGMAHFYRKLLEDSEQKHEATVAATLKPVIGPTPNLTITKPPDFTPISDLELAKKAREEGKEVELNDDNQIVDKRDLLVAGLNLSAPNTRRLGDRSKTDLGKNGEEVQAHRAVGTAATRREINERRAREIQQQMEDEEERLKREKERADHEATQRIVAKRNNEDAVQSARERYLQRKRQRLDTDDEAKPD
ncbi:coiled-coil domain-containing protein 55-domain containing protein [Mycena alexandri]|uniref:Coiled-coil domain-containing protein 55-domain containing protein n=1 Tax=Mycena alexandri TaxID=1745969 RepID=A0AAD6TN23_9AGAR|nr:coiled-coil domain-containing protein 55-domain containing protein [Mycena alexandri]